MDIIMNKQEMLKIKEQDKKIITEQTNAMTQTIERNNKQIQNLETKAAQQDHIAATAMKSETRTRADGTTYTVTVPDYIARAAARSAATALRAQANALKNNNKELKNAILELQKTLEETNAYIDRLIEIVQRTDLNYSEKIAMINDEIESYIQKMQSISDSFYDSFTLASSNISKIEKDVLIYSYVQTLSDELDRAYKECIYSNSYMEAFYKNELTNKQKEFILFIEEFNLELPNLKTFNNQSWDLLDVCSKTGAPNTWDKVGKLIVETYKPNNKMWKNAYVNNPINTLACIKFKLNSTIVHFNNQKDSSMFSECIDNINKSKLYSIMNRTVSSQIIEEIKTWEAYKSEAYIASSTEEKFTIGYGHVIQDGGKSININGIDYIYLSEEQARELLIEDLKIFINKLNNFIEKNKIVLTQNQYDACIMDSFQKGQNIWGNDYSISNYILNGDFNNYDDCLMAFVSSTKNKGLINRRTNEANIFYYGY